MQEQKTNVIDFAEAVAELEECGGPVVFTDLRPLKREAVRGRRVLRVLWFAGDAIIGLGIGLAACAALYWVALALRSLW